MNRRDFVACAAGALPLSASEPEPYDKLFPDMLASYMVTRLNRLATEWDEQRAKIRTSADLDARNRFVRSKVVEMVGGFPPRNPLGLPIAHK